MKAKLQTTKTQNRIHRFVLGLAPSPKQAADAAAQAEDSTEVPKELMTMLPAGAQITGTFGSSRHGIAIFALVDPSLEATEPRTFRIVRTGEDIPEGLEFVGTLNPVLHLFVQPEG